MKACMALARRYLKAGQQQILNIGSSAGNSERRLSLPKIKPTTAAHPTSLRAHLVKQSHYG